jgi:hypothetical protein
MSDTTVRRKFNYFEKRINFVKASNNIEANETKNTVEVLLHR